MMLLRTLAPMTSRWPSWARNWQNWAAAAATMFGLSILALIIAGLMTPDLVPANGDQKIEITGVSGQGLREGHTSWRFAARKADFSLDAAVQTYHDATATYYLRGKPTYKIVATDIVVDSRMASYTATNGVRVWSIGLPEKQYFKTNSVVWTNATQTLTAPGPTELRYHGLAIKTDHLSANMITGMLTTGKSMVKVGPPTPPSTSR